MRKLHKCLIVLGFLLTIPSFYLCAQVGINADNSSPDSSAMLDIKSSIKGFLPPRVTLVALNVSDPIVLPAIGLHVYNTATAGIAPNNVIPGDYFWNGTRWIAISPAPGVNYGDMLFWNGLQYTGIPIGLPGQVLQVSTSHTPFWTGSSFVTVSTNAITYLTSTSALCGGNVSSDGGSSITARGVCYNTSPNPTTSNFTVSSGTGVGSFNSSMTGLLPNTTWFVKAYAINNFGTTYGNEVMFTTLCSSNVTVSININASANPACLGSSVTYISTSTNTGSSPVYQWQVNGIIAGANSPTYNYSPLNGDVVKCVLTSNASCVQNNVATSNSISMAVNNSPGSPVAGSHIPSSSQIIWKWNAVAGSTGYKWNTINDYNTATDIGIVTTKTETGLECNTVYSRFIWAYNLCGNSQVNTLTTGTISNTSSPITGTHTASSNMVIWNWNSVTGALGYKWNTTNELLSATDIGNTTSLIENGLLCNSVYSRYIWAYNTCGASSVTQLTKSTALNPFSPIAAINVSSPGFIIWNWHLVSDASGYKWNTTPDYFSAMDIGMDTTYIETGITCNGTYTRYVWAYNSCTKSNVTTLTQSNWENEPLSPIIGVNITSPNQIIWNWVPVVGAIGYKWNTTNTYSTATDLSTITTKTETGLSCGTKYNRYVWAYGICGYSLPLALIDSTLKTLLPPDTAINTSSYCQISWKWDPVQGATGYRWNTINDYTSASNLGSSTTKIENGLLLDTLYSRYVWAYNSCGVSNVTALNQSTLATVPTPTAGTQIASTYQITWNWNAVTGVIGYKWNTINDFASAINMTTSLSKTETGLSCGTYYTRYVWAYTSCGYSIAVELTDSTLTCFPCGTPISINHVLGAISPVIKTVIYQTTANVAGEQLKCWITQNLGASQQATTVNDATEVAAGWYWQFNRKQGYKHDGTFRTPNTAWIIIINEGMDWQSTNDPCTDIFGNGWRLPTNTEWTNVDATGSWTNYNGPWNSGLKLHTAGNLDANLGAIQNRGVTGYYWSSNQSTATIGRDLELSSTLCLAGTQNKTTGNSVRCIRDGNNIIPIVSTIAVSSIQALSAIGGGNIAFEGGSPIMERGVCWSTLPNPTIVDNHSSDGIGTGNFASSIIDLFQGTTYYVRAFATNSIGTSYGNQVSFTTLCATISPVSISITPSANPLCLGTSVVFTSSSINEGPNPLYQWKIAGVSISGATNSTYTFIPSNNNAITCLLTSNQVCVSGNPATSNTITMIVTSPPTTPTSGSHVATQTSIAWKWNTTAGATGYKWNIIDDYISATEMGTSTTKTETGLNCGTAYTRFAWAYNGCGHVASVALNKSTISCVLPTVTTATITSIGPASAIGGGNVTSDGGGTMTARGVCWNISPNPTIANSKTINGIGTGIFISNLTGLNPSTLYYVRAYATNSLGTAYGNEVSFSTIAYAIGQTVGGGIVFYIDGTGIHGLISATADQSTDDEWGCDGTLIGGTSSAIGTGQANTNAIANDCSTSAAYLCNFISLNGYNDWFLPSKDELNLMYTQRTLIGGFTSNYYWSSSEFNAYSAWYQVFSNGLQDHGFMKSIGFYVRAVRAF